MKQKEAKNLFWVLRTDYFSPRFCDSQNLKNGLPRKSCGFARNDGFISQSIRNANRNRSNGGGGFVFMKNFGIELD